MESGNSFPDLAKIRSNDNPDPTRSKFKPPAVPIEVIPGIFNQDKNKALASVEELVEAYD